MILQDVMLILIALCYVVSACGYALNFYQKGVFQRRLGRWGLWGGWVLHTGLIVGVSLQSGNVPLTLQMLPTVCGWLVVFVYLYLEFSTRDESLGALIVPIVVILHFLSLIELIGTTEWVPVTYRAGWFRLHVLTYVLAYAAFAISCVSSIMYIMLLGEIQAKHLGFFYNRLPSLEVLNQINNRAATFGFIFLMGGMVASTVWAYQELAHPWVWGDPAFLPILVTCVIYAGHLSFRWLAGWQGKRSAFLSIAGFTLVIFAFPVVGVLFSGQHPLGQ